MTLNLKEYELTRVKIQQLGKYLKDPFYIYKTIKSFLESVTVTEKIVNKLISIIDFVPKFSGATYEEQILAHAHNLFEESYKYLLDSEYASEVLGLFKGYHLLTYNFDTEY